MKRFLEAPIYIGEIKDEKQIPQKFLPFPGAWYYKIISSEDKWLGFEGIVTLPEFTADEARYDMIGENKNVKRYKDTPSVYIGGISDFENDIGFGWFYGKINNVVTSEKITYRPFWRYIYLDENNVEKNIYEGTSIDQTEYYFFPGDKLKITLACVKNNYLQLRIELISPTKIEKYCNIRQALNKSSKILLTEPIIAPGNGIKNASYKRVNAIDQYGNEGKPVQSTNAYTNNAVWENMYLFRNIENKIQKVPFIKERYLEIFAPSAKAFQVIYKEDQEIIKIIPNC